MSMTLQQFADSMVDITLQEQDNTYGHYPFMTVVEMPNKKIIVAALALQGVQEVYPAIDKFLIGGATRILSAVDFPAKGDIPHDFVVVTEFANGDITSFAIPYDEAGNRRPHIHAATSLDIIRSNMRKLIPHIHATKNDQPITP